MSRTILLAAVVAMSIGAASAASSPEPSTFRISQIFSNLDGSVQFVELTESAGSDGQHRLAGLTLTSTRNGVVKRFTFPHDLPTAQTANMSIVVSSAVLKIASESWVAPDVAGLPARFLPTDGGTLDFAGIDRTSYEALPTDGVSALFRGGNVRQATVRSNGRCAGMPCPPRFALVQSGVYAIEYYHAALDHYFITASAPDIDALDSGRLPGWTRTGEEFHVLGASDARAGLDEPVCRLYLPPGHGDSHFFSASADECAAARIRFPKAVVENEAAFYAALPDPVTGHCGAVKWPGTSFGTYACPVYRLWNGRVDSNHRYTQYAGVRDQMIARGYVSEGYGPMGVAMCVIVWAFWDWC